MRPGSPFVARVLPSGPEGRRYPGRVSARRLPTPVRTVRSVLIWPLLWSTAAAVATACTEPPPTVAADQATTSTAASAGPTIPAPRDGALRTRIDAAGPIRPATDVDDVLLVGDSVLVLIADDLASELDATLYVDAVDCRELADASSGGCGGVPEGTTIDSGIEAIERAVGAFDGAALPDAAGLVLANNATITTAGVDAAMAATAGIERVWWVNARIDGFGRQDLNNAVLDDLADRDPRAGVIDWFGASDGQDWFADHVHPDDTGQRALAHLVAKNLS